MSSSVAVVIGTRPEAIKLAPVCGALARHGIDPLLVVTGQHPGLDVADYGLGGFPAIRLCCPGQDDPHVHAGLVSRSVLEVLAKKAPQLVVVQGDTSSALGGALAAKVAGIPTAHVEAGLRSHDRRRPWPEEEFRTAIDSHAELLFAPTELSAANLRRERARGRIHVTGNSGIDAVLRVQRGLQLPARQSGKPRLLVTCHRRENWCEGVDGVAAALKSIAAQHIASIEVILHPNPALAARVSELLAPHESIALREPCGHPALVAAMLGSDLVLSDSGGIQEEAAALGIPLLVLREKTERPEAIASGNVELVGTDPGRIVGAVRRRLAGAPAPPALLFGDGRSGERIAAIVEQWLEEKAAGLEPPSPKMASVRPTVEFW